MPIFDAETKAALLRKASEGSRRIQCTEIASSDIMPFINGNEKLGGTALDAVTARYQEMAELEGNSHWAVLSTWFGPIVRKEVEEGRHVKTTLDYIKQAVNGQDPEMLLAKTLWLVPLCSVKEPRHWITTWIDWSQLRIGIFDSIPELASSSWGEPLLLEIVDHVRRALKQDPMEWPGSWRRVIEKPPSLQCQMDGWSCGYYVLMRVRAVAKGTAFEDASFNERQMVQEEAAEILLDLPIIRYYAPVSEDLDDDEDELLEIVSDENVILSLQSLAADLAVPAIPNGHPLRLQNSPIDGGLDIDHDEEGMEPNVAALHDGGGQKAEGVKVSDVNSMSSLRPSSTVSQLVHNPKRPKPHLETDSEGDDTDVEKKKQKLSEAASKPRRAALSAQERKVQLETEQWILKGSVSASSVKCSGCRKPIKLSKKSNKPYELKNWDSHKKVCPRITGKETIRTSAVKASDGNMSYKIKTVHSTPSVLQFFKAAPKSQPPLPFPIPSTSAPAIPPALPVFLCDHLNGPEYEDYISLTHTRQYGGISPALIANVMRCLFPYKEFSALDNGDQWKNLRSQIAAFAPGDRTNQVNNHPAMNKWTKYERKSFQTVLLSFSRWEVNYAHSFIKSSRCEEKTTNDDRVCDSCRAISKDKSLQHAIRKKNNEANLVPEARQKILERRLQYAQNNHLRRFENDSIQDLLADPVLFDIHESLKTGKPEDAFLQLYKQAKAGHLQTFGRFMDVCEVFSDRIRRDTSGNSKLKYGIRYSKSYLDFMIAMRGYGPNSNRQYSILTAEFLGPSIRHLRTLVANSEDALQNPYLIFENVARVKRYVDSIKYSGPIIIGSDCTKVRKRLNFSTQYGCHVLGTVFDLADVEVDDEEDLDEIVERTIKKRAHATQARAILAKIPLPKSPPLAIALLPTDGKEDTEQVHAHHMKLQAMARQLGLPIIALAADGAAVELAAQLKMDHEQSEEDALSYEYPLYGISLKVPVFARTGPLISVTDPAHARKTSRNQPQYGTHTASLGVGHLVNQSLVDLYRLHGSGLVIRDVENVDKQDDGAARRIFHTNALKATVTADGTIIPGFEGTFAYLFIMGSLFEAWMNPDMKLHDRVTAALRARFWLHYWYHHIANLAEHLPDLYSVSRSFISAASFQIFNRLADTLVELALAYSEYYPDVPFCIWLIGTEFVEHFFGIGRQLLPNFSYAEFLKMVQHVMVRQRIMESGILKSKRERESASGYIFDSETDMRKPAAGVLQPAHLSRSDLNELVKIAHDEACFILREILFIPIPRFNINKPIPLRPLGASASPSQKSKHKASARATGDDEDSGVSESEDLEDEDDISNDEDSEKANDAPQEQSVDLLTGQAASDAARYSALCDDLDDILAESNQNASDIETPHCSAAPHFALAPALAPPASISLVSGFRDASSNKMTIHQLLEYRAGYQSGTATKSERSVVVGSKYALNKVLALESESADVVKRKLTSKEASHRLRIAQELNPELKKFEQKKTRQFRWETMAKGIEKALKSTATLMQTKSFVPQSPPSLLPNILSKNVTAIHPLRRNSFVIMRSERRYYIGQVLDLYKRGANSRYGSVDSIGNVQGLSWLSLRVFLPLEATTQTAPDDSEDDDLFGNIDRITPDFTCSLNNYKYHLHTHAPAAHLIYHLGKDALVGERPTQKSLTNVAASHWNAIQLTKAVIAKSPALKIRIPGGKMEKKE